jgi:hypothetical protein
VVRQYTPDEWRVVPVGQVMHFQVE